MKICAKLVRIMQRSVLGSILAVTTLGGCYDRRDLAESSFGKLGEENSRASAASVISMGRDDDDGNARKWHIGGASED